MSYYLLTYLLVTGFPTLVSLIDCLLYIDKMINKNGHTVRTVPKGNSKIVERDNIDIPNTATFYWSACTKPGKWTVMNMFVGGIDFVSVSTVYRSFAAILGSFMIIDLKCLSFLFASFTNWFILHIVEYFK